MTLEINQNQISVSFYTVKLLGKLIWTPSSNSETAFIVITPKNAEVYDDGSPINRGVKLSRKSTVKFKELYDNEIFKGDLVELEIRIPSKSTLDAEFSSGIGLPNNDPLIGLDINLA